MDGDGRFKAVFPDRSLFEQTVYLVLRFREIQFLNCGGYVVDSKLHDQHLVASLQGRGSFIMAFRRSGSKYPGYN